MNDRVAAPTTFDSERIEALGGALIAAASAAGIGVSVVSLEGTPQVVYISDKGVEILGHRREVLMGRPAVDFLTPAAREARSAVAARETSEDRPRTFETMAQRADGHQFPLEVALAPIRLDGRRAMVVFIRDITERRRGVEALERSERRFRQLIELAPDAVWINDGKRLCFANPTAARMLRYESVESLIAADPRNIVAPEDQASMRERTLAMFRTGQPLPPRNYRTLRKDGTTVLTEVHSIPIEWDGAPAILGFARDITARKEMEARLAQSERLASLGTLLGGIAHEMNNPLAYTLLGIEQALQQLGRPVGAGDLDVLREALESAHHGATRVAAIIGQLRASLRSDTEERGPVDVRRMLESALRVTGNELKHRARVVTELQNVPAVLGTASLEQVFLNLLVNAAQALPEGRAENEVRIGLRATAGGDVVVEVADNGAGIADEVRPRIFDPFFTTKPVGVGLGLGLSICHGIVTNHGGTITVESAVGRGSTFRVTLPGQAQAAVAPPEPVQRPQPARAQSPKRLRVLVIDDEPALGAMIRLVLERECHVDLASDARQGLERIESAPPYDVVLCDLMMPHMTGMDLFAEVARRHPGLERRFVFMTGGAFTPREANFLAGVENRRLEKPFDAGGLRAVLRE